MDAVTAERHPPTRTLRWGSPVRLGHVTPRLRAQALRSAAVGHCRDAEAGIWDAVQRQPRIEAKLWHSHPRRTGLCCSFCHFPSPLFAHVLQRRTAPWREKPTIPFRLNSWFKWGQKQDQDDNNFRYVALLLQTFHSCLTAIGGESFKNKLFKHQVVCA